ncbi:MAG: hypothetical protein ACKVS9_08005, partial [Phycisphaerae bacterium]
MLHRPYRPGAAPHIDLRRIACAFAYLIAASLLTACNQGAPPPAKSRNIAPGTRALLLVIDQTDACEIAMICGARRVAAEHPNLILEVAEVPLTADYGREFEETLKRQPAVVIVPASDDPRMLAARQVTLKTGIVLITYGDSNDPPERVGIFGHISTDRAAAAEMLGHELSNFASERKSYVLAQSAADARRGIGDRFRSGVGTRVGPTLLSDATYAESATSGPSGPDAIRALLKQFPNTTLAITLDASPWLAEPPAKLLGERQVMATVGASPALWPALRQRKCIAMVGVMDGQVGEAIMRLAFGALLATEKGPAFRAIPNELVTTDLLERFAHRYAAAAGMSAAQLLPDLPAASQPAVLP